MSKSDSMKINFVVMQCFHFFLCSPVQAEEKISSIGPKPTCRPRWNIDWQGVATSSLTQRSSINSNKSILNIIITLIFCTKIENIQKRLSLCSWVKSMIKTKYCQTNRTRLYLHRSRDVLVLTFSFTHNRRRNTTYVQL